MNKGAKMAFAGVASSGNGSGPSISDAILDIASSPMPPKNRRSSCANIPYSCAVAPNSLFFLQASATSRPLLGAQLRLGEPLGQKWAVCSYRPESPPWWTLAVVGTMPAMANPSCDLLVRAVHGCPIVSKLYLRAGVIHGDAVLLWWWRWHE